jgi:alcohol dehydrogenase (cytochrome c)
MNNRAGAETWIAGSYDPELNLTYWGCRRSRSRGISSAGKTSINDKTLYCELDCGVESRHGKLAVVLPARAG